jgi:hypothetical protein
MTITSLPSPPQTTDPANFDTKADALIAALPIFVAEVNATAAAMTMNATNGTSVTSILIATGSKTFTADLSKSWQLGMTLKIASTASPTNSMLGDVTAYDSGTGSLTVSVTAVAGSGTFASWTISQSGTATNFVTYTQKGMQKFTANGNFTVPAGVTTIYVTAVAGGGGGGGGGASIATANAVGTGGGGGGSGAPLVWEAYTVTPGAVHAITIGDGGIAGTGASAGTNDATAGGNGGDTIIGTLATLTGGSGGGAGQLASLSLVTGGAGGSGVPAGESSSFGGNTGGFVFAGFSGSGAGSPWGGGGKGRRASSGASNLGLSAGYYGGGGGGGGTTVALSTAGAAGGSGTAGFALIEW